MQNHSEKITTTTQLREVIAAEISREGMEMLLTMGLPVYLVSEEYAGLPVSDRRAIINAVLALWQVGQRIEGSLAA